MAQTNTLETSVHVAYVGLPSFPGYLAEAQRARLIAKALIHAGCTVTVIIRGWNTDRLPEESPLQAQGEFEGIKYLFACGTPDRPSSWMMRRVAQLRGFLGEVSVLRRMSVKGHKTGVVVSTNHFSAIVYYRVLAMLFSFPLVVNLVESYTDISLQDSALKKLDALFYDRYAPRLAHGILPISEYLAERCSIFSPQTPLLTVPVLVDCKRFTSLTRAERDTYLLFCGSLAYLEIIRFILNAFARLTAYDQVQLYLVVNGADAHRIELMHEISRHSNHGRIKVFTQLSDQELSELYVKAYALLIPLRPTTQDSARFPHKIAEYCASGRPIVTTKYGEIRRHFIHRKNAMVAERHDPAEYASAIAELLDDPRLAEEVGEQGKALAAQEFDFRLHGPRIKRFIESLLRRDE